LGQIVATPNLLSKVSEEDQMIALNRHANCDWGEADEEDRRANDNALKHGGRILSVYTSKEGVRFWIITEADRTITTILLPEDY
jgi:hypothetical protein